MRILFLTYDFCDNEDVGEIRVVWETIMALAKHPVQIYILTNYFQASSKLPANIHVYQLPFSRRSINFPKPVLLKAFFCSLPIIILKRIQIVHLISTNAPSPYTVFKIRPFVMSADKPWDYDNPKYSEDLLYDNRRKSEESGIQIKRTFFGKLWDKFAFIFFDLFNLNNNFSRNVDLYVCRSKILLEKLKKEKYKSKLVYIPHGVNTKVFYPTHNNLTFEEITFIFVGRISKRKGVEYLIRAFNKLSTNYPKVRLLLVGKGAESTVNYFKNIAGDKIDFLGQVPASQINDYYNKCQVFVLPSLEEPSSLTTLEAMAAGKPIISTRGGVDDFFIEGEMGFWVEAGNVEELYRAMEKFVLRPEIIKPMGEKIIKHVRENFTWSIVVDKLMMAYKFLLDK